MNEKRASSCLGKTAYRTPKEAHDNLKFRKKRHAFKNYDRGPPGVYRCRWCNQWHIGSDSTLRRGR